MRYTLALVASLSLIFLRCAQQVTPTGGKKDEIPPKLLSSIPENKTVNFKGQVISLTFDEYVVVDNLMQKLIITPETENTYTPKLNGETVEIKFKTKFADSTTYTLNFGDGIKDFAERNPAQNLKLVFSTGPAIDSGSVYGTVYDIRTNKPVFDALVGLYQLSDTLTPEKIKPYYFSRTDSSGHFAIENTQISRYALIAITDKNRNLLYNPKDEQIAFLDSVLQVKPDSTPIALKTFHSDITPLKIQRTIPKVNNYTLMFNKGIDSLAVFFDSGDTLAYNLESPTQLKFFNTGAKQDTIKARLVLKDSLGYPLKIDQKIAFLPKRGKEKQTETLSAKLLPEKGEALVPAFTFRLDFNKPIVQFQPQHISILTDTTDTLPAEKLTYSWNKYKTRLELTAATSARDSIKLTFEKGAFISIENDTLTATVSKHAVAKEEDYGVIQGRVVNPGNHPYFLELLDKDYKPVATASASPFLFRFVKPGTYLLRLIIDSNRNGRWDTGNYLKKLQPEQILYFSTPLQVKSNFTYEENVFTIPEH